MNKIENRDNLPKHLRVFLQKMPDNFGDNIDTEIWEMSNIQEFERGAAGLIDEKIKYEIIPTLDRSTDRAYLVGFDACDTSEVISDFYNSKLLLYFVEITTEQYHAWIKRIKEHRELQIEEMFNRQERQKLRSEQLNRSEDN